MRWFSALLLGALPLAGAGPATAAAETPRLVVVGRQLQDPQGHAVQLHGWHQPTEAWPCGKGQIWTYPNHPGALRYLEEVVDTFTTHTPLYGYPHGWYFNQVRIGTDTNEHGTFSHGPIRLAALRKWTDDILVPYVEYCRQRGVYVIVFPNLGLPEKSTTPEVQQTLLQVWSYWSAHPGLKNQPNLQFELCNEPVQAQATDGSWGDTGQKYSDALVQWLQPIVDVIRANGSDHIVWIPGLGYQGHYEGFAKRTVHGTNLGYAVHLYPGFLGGNPKTRDNPKVVEKRWKSNYQPIAALAPVNITEVWWCRWLDEDLKRDPKRYGDLFDGATGDDTWGFGAALKRVTEQQGNVSWCFHMTEHLLGRGPRVSEGDPQGSLNYADPKRDSAAVAAFNWSYEWRDGATVRAGAPVK